MFKNILWIDDLDNSNKKALRRVDRFKTGVQNGTRLSESDIEAIKHYFGVQFANFIQLEKRYCNALDLLNNNKLDYDLIVFDLNFDSDKENIISTYKEICDKLSRGHIIPISKKATHNIMEPDEFISVAGYYLYLFLAMKGFPTNRMVILTGNYSEGYHGQTPDIYLTMLDEDGNCNNDDWDIITKDVAQTYVNNNCDWLARFYDKEKSHYYRIRRLVFQACDYWTNALEKSDLKEANSIPFNMVYFPDKDAVESKSFIEMMEHIKMLFPVTVPVCPEKVYYQAMKTLSMFHEERADISKLDGKQFKRFHSCIRNFRNWSSHNKIRSELSGDKFAILFCIALRTYFQWEDDQSLDDDALQPYEKLYGFDTEIDLPDIPQIINLWLKTWNIVTGDSFIKDLDGKIEKNIRKFRKKPQVMMDGYLFAPIWLAESRMFTIEVAYNPGKENILDSQVNYDPDCNIEEFLKRANNPTNCEGIFMRYCYRWFAEDES